jgi:hypothetical protein
MQPHPPSKRMLRIAPLLAVVAALAVSGCFSELDIGPDPEALKAIAKCRRAAPLEHVLYFGPGQRLADLPQPAGSVSGNAFSSGFLTNDLKEWLSAPVAEGQWIVGEVTLEYWVRSAGTPAPLVIGGDPGEGYHFFNQFGSNRSLQPAYATEYSTVLPLPGAVDHYTEVLAMPPGGFVVEAGDRVRVLLTDLALDGPTGGGHDVLFGGDTPSQVRFTATCYPDLEWSPDILRGGILVTPVLIAGNQGLLTGAVPATATVNQQEFPFVIPPGEHRLSIVLRQVGDQNPVKDDVDIVLLDSAGRAVWSVGSPYSDEAGALWPDNIEAVFPDHQLTIQVNSYSGVGYQGFLDVQAELPFT